jgi:two-component system phosphate regulon sensor histidine kinase PhoR
MMFRTRLFAVSLATALLTVAAATYMISGSVRSTVGERIQATLVNEARLAAETLSHRQPAASRDELDAEADALGRFVASRVTFVAPDGTVVGDSQQTLEELKTLENHANRPEIVQARAEGLGIAQRYSATLQIDMLYVAVPVRNPAAPDIAEVRLAMPLTEIRDQLAAVRRGALLAAASAVLVALALAWLASMVLSRRVRAIASVAAGYSRGDFSRTGQHYGNDEIGIVARALDDSVREINRRAQELDADRTRMGAILGGMIEAVLVVDEDGHLQLVNGAARRMLKLTHDPEGRHYLEIVRHPDVAALLGAALEGRATEGLELTLPRDPGSAYLARSAPIASASARGAVLVLHDITSLRRADRIRRDFVANVSHELRTPLTAVRGYVEALIDGVPNPAEAKGFLETIARHTLRMERLVRDLLRLARLDAGQEALERNPCDVAGLFSAVTAELEPTVTSRDLHVEQRIAAGADSVNGDPAKLHDVLRNLLENAANYAPEHSTIVLSSERVANRSVLVVEDSGPGIPEVDLPRVFERFYRVDKARARGPRDPGGTGLGLAIVKHLVELHGGHVRAENAAHGGARVTVDLPA